MSEENDSLIRRLSVKSEDGGVTRMKYSQLPIIQIRNVHQLPGSVSSEFSDLPELCMGLCIIRCSLFKKSMDMSRIVSERDWMKSIELVSRLQIRKKRFRTYSFGDLWRAAGINPKIVTVITCHPSPDWCLKWFRTSVFILPLLLSTGCLVSRLRIAVAADARSASSLHYFKSNRSR